MGDIQSYLGSLVDASSWTKDLIFKGIVAILFFVQEMLGKAIITCTTAILYVLQNIHVNVLTPTVIYALWQLILNFTNMFFIVILIVMAFATIFQNKKYAYGALLTPLIIIALLINFSYTIAVNVVTLGDRLAVTFIKPIQGSLTTDLDNVIIFKGLVTNLQSTSASVDKFSSTDIIALVFFNISALIIVIALAVVIFFLFLRIPIVWILLISAPFAWMGYILPGSKKYWSMWWNELMSVSFIVPIYLLFLTIGMTILKQKDSIAPILATGVANSMFPGINVSLNDILFYLIAIAFIVGGLIISRSATKFSGSQAGNLFGYIENKLGVSQTALQKGTGAFSAIPGVASVQRGRFAVSATADRIGKEGLPGRLNKIYGGEKAIKEAQERTTNRFQNSLGFETKFNEEKNFITESNTELDGVKDDLKYGRTNRAQLRQKALTANPKTEQGYAYIKAAAQEGVQDGVVFDNTVKGLQGSQFALEDYIKATSDGKFKDVPAKNVITYANGGVGGKFATQENTAARRETYKGISTNKGILTNEAFDSNTFEKGISLLGGPDSKEGKQFLEDVAKVRPDITIEYKQNYNKQGVKKGTPGFTPSDKVIDAKTTKEQFVPYLKSTETVANLPPEIYGKPDFIDALKFKIAALKDPKARDRYVDNLVADILSGEKSQEKVQKLTDASIYNPSPTPTTATPRTPRAPRTTPPTPPPTTTP